MQAYKNFKFNNQGVATQKVALKPPLKLVDCPIDGLNATPRICGGNLIAAHRNGELIIYEEQSFRLIKKVEFPFEDKDLGRPPNLIRQGLNSICFEESVVFVVNDHIRMLNLRNLELGAGANQEKISITKGDIVSDKILYAYDVLGPKKETFAYSLENGSFIWTRPNTAQPPNFLQKGDSLFSNGFSREKNIPAIYALNAATGQLKWETTIGKLGKYEDIFGKTIGGYLGDSCIVEDMLIVGINSATILALDIHSGKQLWSLSLSDEHLAPSLIYYEPENTLYVLGQGIQCKVDVAKGEVMEYIDNLDEYEAHDVLGGGYAVTDHHIYMADSMKGKLAAFDKKSGKLVWKYDLKASCSPDNFPLILNDRLYLVDYDGNFYVFEEA